MLTIAFGNIIGLYRCETDYRITVDCRSFPKDIRCRPYM